MTLTHYWRHATITGDAEGRCVLQSTNSTGTKAVNGGGWLGGDSSSTDQVGLDAAGAAPVLASYPTYDSGTGTTYWFVMYTLPPGASARAHMWWTVES